jgi:hypothetical protein
VLPVVWVAGGASGRAEQHGEEEEKEEEEEEEVVVVVDSSSSSSSSGVRGKGGRRVVLVGSGIDRRGMTARRLGVRCSKEERQWGWGCSDMGHTLLYMMGRAYGGRPQLL